MCGSGVTFVPSQRQSLCAKDQGTEGSMEILIGIVYSWAVFIFTFAFHFFIEVQRGDRDSTTWVLAWAVQVTNSSEWFLDAVSVRKHQGHTILLLLGGLTAAVRPWCLRGGQFWTITRLDQLDFSYNNLQCLSSSLGMYAYWIIYPQISSSHGLPLLSIRVASLADVDTIYSWVQKWQIEPSTWISLADRRNLVSSGNVVFSPTPSFSDGVKWDGL